MKTIISSRYTRAFSAMAATAVMALAATSPAQASNEGCRLVIEGGQDNWMVRFDPFAQSEAMRHFDISVVNRGSGHCNGALSIGLNGESYGLSQIGDGQRVNYAIMDARNGADLTPRAGRNSRSLDQRGISIAPGQREILRFSMFSAPSQTLSAGTYSQNATISIEDEVGAPLVDRHVTLGLDIPSVAIMGLKGRFTRQDGIASIDLGELRNGSQDLNTSLFVLSTGGYVVSISSENNGRLRQDSSDWYIPYNLSVGERRVDLVQGDEISVNSKRARADDYPLRVNIREAAGKRAGRYNDVITFTVAAI